jgi:hypothetical protein
MADDIQSQVSEPVYKDKHAKYRAKNREKRRQQSAEWWRENGEAYREANRVQLRETATGHRERNRDKIRARISKYQQENPEKQRESEEKYRRNHPDRRKASVKAHRGKPGVLERERESRKIWAARNKDLLAMKSAARRAAKLLATPSWADQEKIATFYIEAQRLTFETGIQHDVDHIVPLKSKLVCGLHVETNLQILIGAENKSKGNRTWPNKWLDDC